MIAADRAGEGRPVPRWYVVLVQRDVIAENLQDEGRQLTVRGELRLDSAEAPYGRPECVVRGEMSVSASRAGRRKELDTATSSGSFPSPAF